MKLFFIKKHYRETERHYWLHEDPFAPKELTRQKVVDEFIALAFYRLLGIVTPKTYVGALPNQAAVLISKVMSHWSPLSPSEQTGQVSPLGAELDQLPVLEAASAILTDIDVSGWNLDNLGLKQKKRITKHDGGASVLDPDRKKYYLDFFKHSATANQFPEGVSTLTDDHSLNTTFLKIFKVESVTLYHKHYYSLFDHITQSQRKLALKSLFKIHRDDLMKIFDKIPDNWRVPSERKANVDFLLDRIESIRQTFKEHFTITELYPADRMVYSDTFKKLLAQKSFEKDDWQNKYTRDDNYANPNDFSQSQPFRYIKSRK